jgi:adenylate cyclase
MMQKLLWRIGIPVFILSIAGLVLSSHRALENPLARDQELDYPQFAAQDDQGNYYVIDNSLRRVSVADRQGNIITQIEGGSRDEGRFFYADQVIVSDGDGFFLLNYVLDTNGMFLRREEILEYSGTGRLMRTFYRREYDDRRAELVQRGEIFSPRIQRGYLYFFLVDNSGIQFIRKSLNRETTEILGETYFLDANAYVADIEWLDTEQFLILDKRGHLIRGDIYGDLRRIDFRGPGGQVLLDLREDEISVDYYRPEVPPFQFWDMAIAGDGRIYLSDLIGQRIVAIESSSVLTELPIAAEFVPVLDREILSAAGYSDEPFFYYRLGSAPTGFVAPYDFGMYRYSDDAISDHVTYFSVPGAWTLLRVLWWLSLVLIIASSAMLIIAFYLSVLNRRLSLILKQLLIIVPLMAGGIFIISTILLENFKVEYERGNVNNILALTQTVSQSIDGDLFHTVQTVSDYMNDDYREIRDNLRRALNYNSDRWNEGLYFAVYQVLDETLYGFMYLNNRIGMRHPFNWYDDPQSVYRMANDGEVVFEQVEDISGSFLYAVGPIYDSDNQIVALLEIGTDLFSFTQNTDRLYSQAMALMSIIGALIVGFITLMTYLILRSLRILRRGVERVAEGDWNYQIQLKSNDEVSELGQRFNNMSDSISNYLQQIRNMNESYQKFFPDQFLKYLDLSSLTEVKLGDQVRRKMTIMFSDIRSFTSISEQMTPEENFNFLNSYLNLVGPVIRQHHGFIDKYIGDAIMALFPDTAEDALGASVSMLSSLRDFNRQRIEGNKIPVNIGIGIHTGELMLGILGEEERMQGTVISDSVNFAARLETLTKQMGASILTSSDTLKGMNGGEGYLKRYMGRIRVMGKTEAVEVYEILNGLPEEEIEAKLRVKSMLREGIAAFEAEDMAAARSVFTDLGREEHNGKIAALFLGCIDRYHSSQLETTRRGVPAEPWEGILKPESK